MNDMALAPPLPPLPPRGGTAQWGKEAWQSGAERDGAESKFGIAYF